jgi:hypothetical protein
LGSPPASDLRLRLRSAFLTTRCACFSIVFSEAVPVLREAFRVENRAWRSSIDLRRVTPTSSSTAAAGSAEGAAVASGTGAATGTATGSTTVVVVVFLVVFLAGATAATAEGATGAETEDSVLEADFLDVLVALILVVSEERFEDMERGITISCSGKTASTLVCLAPKVAPEKGTGTIVLYEMKPAIVGMNTRCLSIRGKKYPTERCSFKSVAGEIWCARHLHQKEPVRFDSKKGAKICVEKVSEDIVHHLYPSLHRIDIPDHVAWQRIAFAWRRWFARRAGPLVRFRELSNNPNDFYSSDSVMDISLHNFISFVDNDRKGYCMHISSAVALVTHAAKEKESPLNPFNRNPLPPVFLRRIALHGKVSSIKHLRGFTDEEQLSLDTTDVFRLMEDLGHYTDPSWFLELSRLQLIQFYIEIIDIWKYRAGLSAEDRVRLIPSGNPFQISAKNAIIMTQYALQRLILNTCRMFVSSASTQGDRRTGALYILGVLTLLHEGARNAYPWIAEMFLPGITSIQGHQIIVSQNIILH